jgi:FkbM family methyltransferase
MAQPVRFSPAIESVVRAMLKRLGVGVTSYSNLEWLLANHQAAFSLGLLQEYPAVLAGAALPLLKKSRAQFRQDVFVLLELAFKAGGYFVEFGAADGIEGSNTYLLEQEFGWTGILAEPAKVWHADLQRNRHCRLETRCVWRESGARLAFNEVSNAQLSTIAAFNPDDRHRLSRRSGTTYDVTTISLVDLLDAHGAPRFVDYLSIDTEGSEFEILANFDFDKYRFGVITCEHNYTSARADIHRLLTYRGYVRKFENLSQTDDWYVSAADGAARESSSVGR